MKEYEYIINDKSYKVRIEDVDDDRAKVEVNGMSYEVEVKSGRPYCAVPRAVQAAVPPPAAPQGPAPTSGPKPAPAAQAGAVSAPMPGVVLKIFVAVGDEVKPGDVLMVIEAMKMENDIKAPRPGKITKITVSSGQNVATGQALAIID